MKTAMRGSMQWHKIGKWLQYGLIFMASGAFLVLDHLPDRLRGYVSVQDLAGVALFAVAGLLFSTNQELLAIKRNYSPIRHYRSLAEALGDALNGRTRIGMLRVLAQTSDHVLPNMQQRLLSVAHARVLLRDFGSLDGRHATLNQLVTNRLQEWAALQTDGIIQTIEVGRYVGAPTMYTVIVDAQCAIVGLYYRKDNSPANDAIYAAPFLIENSDESGRAVIEDLVHWFDRHFIGWNNQISETSPGKLTSTEDRK